ncbi:MAG: DUF2953 domain-containing protein [Oscillospiraceae bacterium]|nr:DUF2953 domain-containing protein [Oscillospiraceae bacterium]MDD7355378.1 DUF2953 domain-containing protein [Oscillospiraceae bacterium]MDY3938482.1 DUF2953 domain-containing protein [Oscillospiraceae bacterium]
MIALYIILGIILFFIAVLSIRFRVYLNYDKKIESYAQWLFIKIPLYPRPEKKPKKEKKKKDGGKKEETEEEKKEEPPKKKKDNILLTFYNNEGLDGIISILSSLITALDKVSRRITHCFVLNLFILDATVARGDAAETAITYGKYSSVIFPLAGDIISRCNVKKYDINISPDFLADKGDCQLEIDMAVIPRKLINSVILLVFDLLFNVLIKFIKGIKKKKTVDNTNNKNISESGV